MFLNFIKDFFLKRILKNNLHNVMISSASSIKTVGLLIDESYFFEKDALVKELKANGILESDVKLIVYKDKLRKNEIYSLPTFSIKHLDWKAEITYPATNDFINEKFDLYIVDGPHGSERYSRYDIVSLISKLNEKDQFIIIIDDTERQGEKDTVTDIKELLKTKNISYYQGNYIGNKCVTLIVSEKYKYSISM